MSIDIDAITNALVSHAQTLGVFDRVNGHEPKSAPGRGITCAIWIDGFNPAASGLRSTSVVMTFLVRIFNPANVEPADRIDPECIKAIDALMTAYIGDFTLGNVVPRGIDIRGKESEGLRGRAGYLTQDQKQYRVYDIFVPVIVNDAWSEAA